MPCTTRAFQSLSKGRITPTQALRCDKSVLVTMINQINHMLFFLEVSHDEAQGIISVWFSVKPKADTPDSKAASVTPVPARNRTAHTAYAMAHARSLGLGPPALHPLEWDVEGVTSQGLQPRPGSGDDLLPWLPVHERPREALKFAAASQIPPAQSRNLMRPLRTQREMDVSRLTGCSP